MDAQTAYELGGIVTLTIKDGRWRVTRKAPSTIPIAEVRTRSKRGESRCATTSAARAARATWS
jgi:hypothetical protein